MQPANPGSPEMPALCLRDGDLLVLAEHFLKKMAFKHLKAIDGFTEEAKNKILEHKRLGDVRELETAIERAVLACNGAMLDAADISFESPSETTFAVRIPGTTIAELERHAIIKTLEACGGSTAKAAELLGISIRTIQYRMHQYGLRRPAEAPSPNERQANAL